MTQKELWRGAGRNERWNRMYCVVPAATRSLVERHGRVITLAALQCRWARLRSDPASEEDLLDIDFVCDSNQIALDQLNALSVTVDRIEVMDESDSSDENSLHIEENDLIEDIKHNMQIDICDNELPGGQWRI
ncbi:hypothetical protein ACJJTC_003742 [Scirpophaga incertulas]